MITLRNYQQESFNKVYPLLKPSFNVLLVEPTGAGKTIIKAEFAKVFKNKNKIVAVFAHRDVLLSQISASLCLMGVTHNFICANKTIKSITDEHIENYNRSFYDVKSNVTVISVDTFHARLKKGMLNDYCQIVDFWMLDEAHHCLRDNKWGKCVKSLVNATGLGVTATPLRADGKGLGSGENNDGVFDELIVGSTIGELISRGFLSPYKIYVPPTLVDTNGVNITSSGDYNQKELAKRTNKIEITGDTVDQYIKYGKGKQVITFCVNIAHSDSVAEEFNKKGIRSVSISSKTDSTLRKYYIKQFRNGVITNLCNCDLFDEGFDVPAVCVVIMLRKTWSYSKFKQVFGRMLRVLEGKEFGILIDQVGNVKIHCIHGLPHDDPEWTLDRTKLKRGDNSTTNARVCPECFSYYVPKNASKNVCPDCDHEETFEETNAQVQEFLHNDEDLVEMNVDFIDQLIKERKKVDRTTEEFRKDLSFSKLKGVGRDSAIARHKERLSSQKILRATIQSLGTNLMKKNKWNLKTFQIFFEKEFKYNILKAQVLSSKKSLELNSNIKSWRKVDGL